MQDFPHLSRAPITEALLTFQANAAAHWGEENMLSRLKALWPNHPDPQELQQVNMQFSAKSGEQPRQDTMSAQILGWIFRSETEHIAHQVRRDGYTFSRLKPYEDWESFEMAAKENWQKVSEILEPAPLHSVAARFINLLEIPTAKFKWKRYFTTQPPCPAGLKWQFQGFVQQAVYAVPDSECTVQVTFSPSFSAAPKETSIFMLDIDVSLKQSLPSSGKSVDEVLDEMHLRKNQAFFGMLTKEAIALYRR